MNNVLIDPIFHEYYSKSRLVLVDIGAAGEYPFKWKPAEKYLQLIGFEPIQMEFEKLPQNNHFKYFNTALYDKKDRITLYIKKKGNASILKSNIPLLREFPDVERHDLLKTEEIETDTLDNQFRKAQIDKVDFIKLDTDGSELFILKGAKETIRSHIFGLEVEVEFIELYENQPLFADVDAFIKQQGFELWDIQRHYWQRKIREGFHGLKGQLVFGNAVYLRKLDNFQGMIDILENDFAKKSKILNAVTVCLIYGYGNYGLELLKRNEGLFEQEEYHRAFKSISKKRGLLPSNRYTSKIASGIYAIGNFLSNKHEWSAADSKIGNVKF
jgi:FkbM family methyltransferase